MKCSRCQGLVVRDQLYDPDGPYLQIAILRCLNCGETTYLNKGQGKTPTLQKSTHPGSKGSRKNSFLCVGAETPVGEGARTAHTLGMKRTSNAARRDGSTPTQRKLFLREP